MFFPFHDDNPTQRTPVITCALIAVNVISFVWLQRLPPVDRQMVAYRRGFVPARITRLKDRQPVKIPLDRRVLWNPLRGRVIQQRELTLPPVPREVLASLLTCMFLHAGWMHLIGNMWFLWLFGNNVEDRLGGVAFLILYLGGGLLASGSHWMVEPNSLKPVIGASGAVATVLGAYAITWPWARVHTVVLLVVFVTIIEVPALVVLGLWFAVQLLAGRDALQQGVSGGVAWWAHVGGFVAGVVLMPLVSAAIGADGRKRPTRKTADDL